MKTKRVGFLILILSGFLIFSSNQTTAEELSSGKSEPFVPIDRLKPQDVDFSGLDAAGSKKVIDWINISQCFCGCNQGNVARCMVNDDKCRVSRRMAEIITSGVRMGQSDQEINEHLAQYESEYKKKKAERIAKKTKKNQKIYTVDPGNEPLKGREDAPITIKLRETRPVLSFMLIRSSEAAKAYQIAQEIPQVIDAQYCYCHCDKSLGHKSLLSCFATLHGASCVICQQEVFIAYVLYKKGFSIEKIQSEIERRFDKGKMKK